MDSWGYINVIYSHEENIMPDQKKLKMAKFRSIQVFGFLIWEIVLLLKEFSM